MSNLNQETKKVFAAQRQVNSEGIHIVHIENLRDHIAVVINPAYGNTQCYEFWRTVPDMKEAFRIIDECAVSPIGSSSAKDGNLLEVTA